MLALQSGAVGLSDLLRLLLKGDPSELLFLFSPDIALPALEISATFPGPTTGLDVFGRALKK